MKSKKLTFIIALFITSITLISCEKISKKIEERRDKMAADYYSKSIYCDSLELEIEYLTKAIAVKGSRNRAKYYRDRAWARNIFVDHRKAIQDCNSALTTCKNRDLEVDIYTLLGLANYYAGDFSKSEDYYNVVYSYYSRQNTRHDDDVATYYLRKLADAKNMQGKNKEALKDYNTLIKIDDEAISTILFKRGVLKHHLGDYVGAMKDYDEAYDKAYDGSDFEHLSHAPTFFYNKGRLKQKLKDDEAALKYYKKAFDEISEMPFTTVDGIRTTIKVDKPDLSAGTIQDYRKFLQGFFEDVYNRKAAFYDKVYLYQGD